MQYLEIFLDKKMPHIIQPYKAGVLKKKLLKHTAISSSNIYT
jgi:hypothetical protein